MLEKIKLNQSQTIRNLTPNRKRSAVKIKNQFTLEEDFIIQADRCPSDEFKKIKLLGKGGQAAVFEVLYKGQNIALKQTSKCKNKKMKSDVDAAVNELDLQH